METFKHRESRIWEMKEDKYTKPGNSSVLYRKTKNPFETKIFLYKGFEVL